MSCCTVCGTWCCADCAPPHRFLGEPVCPACAPSVARQLVRGASSVDGRRSGATPPQGLRLFGLALGVVLLILLVTKVILPASLRPPAAAEREATLRAAFVELGLALEKWKGREGVYPERLEQLVPQDIAALPRDPWDPESGLLRYTVRPTRDGPEQAAVLLYSVGPDGVDNGGLGGADRGAGIDRLYPVW